MNIIVEYLAAELLKPHEDVELQNLMEIIKQLKINRKIKPIIVDKNTYTILDGHHRFTALKLLGFRQIPSILVDYNSDEVSVNKWYHIIPFTPLARRSLDRFFNTEGEVCMKIFDTRVCDEDAYKLLWKLHAYEKFLVDKLGLQVRKNAKEGIEPPTIEKRDVVKISEERKIFPPKTTRHTYKFIIPEISITIR
ncbi:MAG: ParB N-terminal domain-containing protein [Sulfolobaceae archaeon]|nr:ParB N-terminal domain-containing protein [Sulfolobaceae archaeon]